MSPHADPEEARDYHRQYNIKNSAKNIKITNKRLCVHHVDGDKDNNKVLNLCCMCIPCHNIIHDKRGKKP